MTRARARLGSDVIVSTPTGYRLSLREDEIDAGAVVLSASASAGHARAGDHVAALADAEAGLELCEGPEDWDTELTDFTKALAGEPRTRAQKHEAAMHAGLGYARRGKGELASARTSWAQALSILNRLSEADTSKARALHVALTESTAQAIHSNGRAVS